MERRNFLTAAGASGLAVAGDQVHAPVLDRGALSPSSGPVPDMDAYVARMDEGMAYIAKWSPSSQYQAFAGDRAAVDSLAQKALRTLYVTGMFADLPPEAQRHAGLQERMQAALPEMDEALDEMTSFLESRPAEELDRIQTVLRMPEDVGGQIADALDAEAAKCGVSEARRIQTRGIMDQVMWRLRNQPPALLIDEVLRKIEKVTASDVESAGREQWLAARVGERVFWQQAQTGTSPRGRTVRRGAKAMGIGLAIFAASAGFALLTAPGGAAWVGVFGATVGAIWFTVGLLTLLIGLMLSGKPDRP